jgi:hypothetical protein
MERQQVLYQRDHLFHFVIGEQALYPTVLESSRAQPRFAPHQAATVEPWHAASACTTAGVARIWSTITAPQPHASRLMSPLHRRNARRGADSSVV